MPKSNRRQSRRCSVPIGCRDTLCFVTTFLNLMFRSNLNCYLKKMCNYPICAAVGKRRWRFSPPPSRKIVARKKVRPPSLSLRCSSADARLRLPTDTEVREAGPLEWAFPFRSNAGAKSVRPLHACPDCQICPTATTSFGFWAVTDRARPTSLVPALCELILKEKARTRRAVEGP